jgi:hypothetical protein
MRSSAGIAIISTIFIMVAVLALGIGALYLTNIDLRIAENVQSNAVAKQNAQIALEASLIALRETIKAEDAAEFPETFTAPTLTLVGDLPVTVGNPVYTRLSPTQATLRVEGIGPGQASYLAEAALALMPAETVAASGVGLVSQAAIAIHDWTNTRIIDAQLHGDAGFSLTSPNLSRVQRCTARALSGSCAAFEFVDMSLDEDGDGVPDNLPLSAAAGLASYLCQPAADGRFCRAGRPTRLTDAAVITAFSAADLLETERNRHGCDVTLSSVPTMQNSAEVVAAGFVTGRTVCLTGGMLAFPSDITLTNVRIISRSGDIRFADRATLANVTLIAEAGTVSLGSATLNSSFIYSHEDLSVASGVRISGRSTLVSAGALSFAGVTEASGAAEAARVDIYLYADGAITYRSNTPTFARFFAGGAFTVNSNSCIIGSVEARGAIHAPSGVCIDAGLSPRAAREQVGGRVRVLSRR